MNHKKYDFRWKTRKLNDKKSYNINFNTERHERQAIRDLWSSGLTQATSNIKKVLFLVIIKMVQKMNINRGKKRDNYWNRYL